MSLDANVPVNELLATMEFGDPATTGATTTMATEPRFRDLPPAQRTALRAIAFRGVAYLGNDTITGPQAEYTTVAQLPAWALHRRGLVIITDGEIHLTTSGLALVDSTKIKIVP